MTKLISVKELRTRFPAIRREIEQGTRFILLHRSRPVGELGPVKITQRGEDIFGFFARPPARFRLRSKKSAVELIREERTRS
ncbi:MAG: hypothetical protein HY007_01470 [Candidatus Sungbacteria bacterium]|nr:hypothetical protein [Candidatus Sungbacteria bacterium]